MHASSYSVTALTYIFTRNLCQCISVELWNIYFGYENYNCLSYKMRLTKKCTSKKFILGYLQAAFNSVHFTNYKCTTWDEMRLKQSNFVSTFS